jgi:SAM-dependent methyltransferase
MIHIADIKKLICSSDEYQFFKKFEKKLDEFKISDIKKLKQELKNQSLLKKRNAIFYVDLPNIAYEHNPAFTERFTEYFWVLKNLDTTGRILDIGCTESSFAREISKIKTLEVYGIDIRSEKIPPYKFFLEDARQTHFENNFFDQITIISSIEHFGLDIYGNNIVEKDADLKAMKEIKRILKKDGTLFLTTPFGKNGKPWYRKYNANTLNNLFSGYIILEQKYFHQTDMGWVETDVKHASEIGDATYYFGSPLPGAITVVKAQPQNLFENL